mgnify:CR=1 FL=1
MHNIPVVLVIEDDLSLVIAKHIINNTENKYYVYKSLPDIRRKSGRGSGYIHKKIGAFNRAAEHQSYIILTDLDDRECAPTFYKELLPDSIHENLLLQIAVREVETWLLADRQNFASFLGTSKNKIESVPENIDDPKQYIFNLARRSNKRIVREGLLPPDATSRLGPLYNPLLMKFVDQKWDLLKARNNSQSLDRFIKRITEQ